MGLLDGFPSASGLADANDVRRGLAGLVIRDSSGNPRTGVFPRHANALVTSTATMNSAADGAEFLVSRTGQGAVFLANDGVTNVLHDAAPVANSRYDIVYVKQNDNVAPNADASNTPAFGILKGTASPSPTLPTYATAKAALIGAVGIGEGAEPLTAVLIPSTATTMQSAGVVYTQLYQYTAASGGLVHFRTKTALDLWTTAGAEQRAVNLADGQEWVRRAGAWVNPFSPEDSTWIIPTLNAGWTPIADAPGYRKLNGVVFLKGRATTTGANRLAFTLPAGFRPDVIRVWGADQNASPIQGVIEPTGGVGQSSGVSGVGFSFGSAAPFPADL